MNKYYKRVEIDAEGNSAELVNFVGVHPLRWNRSDRTIQGNTPPDAGFVEAEAYEREFVEWCIIVPVFTDDGITIQPITNEVFKTINSLHEYWQKTNVLTTKDLNDIDEAKVK